MSLSCFRVSTITILVASTCVFTAWAAETNSPTADTTPPVRELIPRGGHSIYRLGPGDEIKVFQANAPELDGKAVRLDDLGFVSLPLIGRVKLGGLTLEESEQALTEPLGKYLVSPRPVVSITEYKSQPVSVLGAVNTPGVLQLQGRKTLIEMISMAGGPRPDAGTEIEVTRNLSYGTLPLANAKTDSSGDFSTAKINLVTLMKGVPESNIAILPHDVISVPRAELIYVTGSVKKPGGFPVSTNGSISVLQALSLAEGVAPDASTHNARIVRSLNGDGNDRQEIHVDVGNILRGKATDFDLQPRDILFIPDNTGKKIGMRFAEIALQSVVGVAIWHAW